MNKVKEFVDKAKLKVMALPVAAVAAASTCVVANAEEPVDTSAMTTAITSAGNNMTALFTDLVTTLIPVIIGILGSGLVLFGIMALIKLAKKTFNKVAG